MGRPITMEDLACAVRAARRALDTDPEVDIGLYLIVAVPNGQPGGAGVFSARYNIEYDRDVETLLDFEKERIAECIAAGVSGPREGEVTS